MTQTERSPLRDAPQQWIDQQFHTIVTDLVGTPTELVNDQGGIDWFHRTTLWGNTLDQRQHGDVSTPLRFPGQYHDPETGLNYNLHRHYDPISGRYTSTDPLGLEAGPDPHRYVANPHELIDPLGLAVCTRSQAKKQLPDRLTKGPNAKGGYRVYLGRKNKKHNYVGITDNLNRRRKQHGRRFSVMEEQTKNPISKGQARTLEQMHISEQGKNFTNSRNEISTKRPEHNPAVEWAQSYRQQGNIP